MLGDGRRFAKPTKDSALPLFLLCFGLAVMSIGTTAASANVGRETWQALGRLAFSDFLSENASNAFR